MGMMVLYPLDITSITVHYTGSSSPDYPVTNLLLDAPGVTVHSDGTTSNIVGWKATIKGTFNSLCIHGVYSSTSITSATLSGPTLTNLVQYEIDDPYHVGWKSYWWVFDPITLTSSNWISVIITAPASPTSTIIGKVLKAGTTYDVDGLCYPLNVGIEDTTPQIQMADGAIYRGAEIEPVRVISGTVMGNPDDVLVAQRLCRFLAGQSTVFHFSPESGDEYFVYGRTFPASVVLSSMAIKSASISVREWV